MGMEIYLAEIRDCVASQAPDLLPMFKEYAGEASFGMALIAEDLDRLPSNATVLEIGAGSHLLSCWLQRQGYRVIAVEPIGSGFSHFDRLREVVLGSADKGGYRPDCSAVQAEFLALNAVADFAFSINVMEHVIDVGSVLKRVYAALKPGGSYRFVCPNYIFPYEPHFNIPTLVSRKLTERVLGRWIFSSRRVADPRGTWDSLNWITVPKVRKACLDQLGQTAEFSRSVWRHQLKRVLEDSDFQRRRGFAIRSLFKVLDKLGLTELLSGLPVLLLPVIDCRIYRLPASQT